MCTSLWSKENGLHQICCKQEIIWPASAKWSDAPTAQIFEHRRSRSALFYDSRAGFTLMKKLTKTIAGFFPIAATSISRIAKRIELSQKLNVLRFSSFASSLLDVGENLIPRVRFSEHSTQIVSWWQRPWKFGRVLRSKVEWEHATFLDTVGQIISRLLRTSWSLFSSGQKYVVWTETPRISDDANSFHYLTADNLALSIEV